MTGNADVILFTYSVVLVGITTGLQMLYFGARGRSLRLGGTPLAPAQLRSVGAIFSVTGALAFAVMAVEILSGAAGTDIWPFIGATFIVPAVVAVFNVWRDKGAMPS